MKAITTRYIGPSNTRGSHMVADDGDGNRVTHHYRSELNAEQNHANACKAMCKKMGWGGQLQAGDLLKAGRTVAMVWVWIDKRDQIKVKPLKSFTHPVS